MTVEQLTREVTRDLRSRLAQGEWEVNEQFATFGDLMDRYPAALTNIGRVRAALAPLISEGLIESIQGSGSWVRRLPEEVDDPKDLADEVVAELGVLTAKVERLRRLLAAA
jgi:DNA-binding GntR family transcriptional regulator